MMRSTAREYTANNTPDSHRSTYDDARAHAIGACV